MSSPSTTATTPAPLSELETPLRTLLTSLVPFIWRISKALFTLLTPIPTILRYALSPLTKFLEMALLVLVWTPYRMMGYLIEALLPLYTFVGVACITGLVLGGVGRLVCWKLVEMVNASELVSIAPGVQDEGTKRSSSVRRNAEKISVKFEEDG